MSTEASPTPSSSQPTPTPPSQQTPAKPLLLAAYKYSDPSRKRRVKVPSNILWKDFLSLFYSRLDISSDVGIEIFDERGSEIVTVDDLVDNDVLVIREVPSRAQPGKSAWPSSGTSGGNRYRCVPPTDPFGRSHDQAPPSHMMPLSNTPGMKPHDILTEDHLTTVMLGTPHLSHFIQCNSFGYYFLAEVNNIKFMPSQGKARKAHCIVKVPHFNKDTFHTLENEANLLRRIAYHKSVITPPEMHIINFSEEKLQRFFYSEPQHKQALLRQLFTMGGAMEAYVYPLYGVTMATKIKSSLVPERVLKYVYQLADIMHYLEQRGVIHQNFLPENIQVMSNDRVILCNFETAIQTDPTTCLVVVSGRMAAPSNRTGLAPEVITAFNRLRIESEMVDYSTQYRWMFGVLAILISTGLHPLPDYPAKYEEGRKIRYRSHHIQSLPDSEKYPPVFLKLVKRAISCDPVRRLTLPQILTFLKRDPKIVSLMTGNKVPADRSRKSSAGPVTASSSSATPHLHQQTAQGSKTTGKGFLETHPPPSAGNSAFTGYYPLPNSPMQYAPPYNQTKPPYQTNASSKPHDQKKISHDSHVTSRDPFLPPPNRNPQQPNSRAVWHTFSDDTPTNAESKTPGGDMPSNEGNKHLPLRRYGSAGAFSDDFVMTRLSREPSNQSPLHSVRRAGSASHLATSPSHLSRDGHFKALGRSVELLGAGALANSEGDLKHLKEFQYQRLIHSPNVASSQELSPTIRRSGDMEHLIHTSSPEPDSIQENTARKQRKNTEGEVWRSLTGKKEEARQVLVRKQAVSKQGTPEERRNLSGHVTSTTNSGPGDSLAHLGDFSTDIFQHMSALGDTWRTSSGEMDSQELEKVMKTESSSTTGLEACLLSSTNTTTDLTQNTPSLDLTDPSSQGGVAHHDLSSREQSMEISLSEGGRSQENRVEGNGVLSSVFHPPGSQFWSNLGGPPPDLQGLNVFPQALDSESNLLSEMVGTQSMSQDLSAPTHNEELTPKDNQIQEPKDSSVNVSSWVQDVNQATTSDHMTPGLVSTSGSYSAGSAAMQRNYDPMSPIPEASQELTSSMSQPTHPNHRHSGSHLHSISPISELGSIVSSTAGSNRQRSISPLANCAVNGVPLSSSLPVNDHEIPSSGTEQRSVESAERSMQAGSGTSHSKVLRLERASQSDGGSTLPTSVPDHVSMSEVSLASSTRLQVTSDSNRNSRTSRQPTPLSDGVQQEMVRRDSSVTSQTSGQVTLAPSQEDIGERNSGNRSSTPQSASSAPPRINTTLSSQSRESTRPLSPLATTRFSANSFPAQTTQSSRSKDHHGNFPRAASALGNESRQQLSSPTRVPQGSGVSAGGGGTVGGSRMRYSQKRHDGGSSRNQHRISQDLDMMNLAISGMDTRAMAPVTNSRPTYSQTWSFLQEEQRGTQHHRTGQRPLQSPVDPSSQPRSSNSLPKSSHSLQNSTSSTTIPADSVTFRPITPATTRPSSSPWGNREEVSSRPSVPTATPRQAPPTAATQQRPRQSHDSRQFSQSAGYGYGSRNQQHANSRDTRHLSHSAGHQDQASRSIPLPPQVTADSYDYLPPYSPPTESRAGGGGQQPPPSHNQPQQRQQQQIQQRQQQQQQGAFAENSYPDPPPSYDEIFGRSSSNGKEAKEPSRRRSRHRNEARSQRTRSERNSSPRQPSSNFGRLSSLTNLFRRTLRHTRSEGGTDGGGGPPVADDYTAQWVASYSHTPRPHDAMEMQQQQQQSRSPATPIRGPTVSSPGSPQFAVSRQLGQPHPRADANPYVTNPPIPYRHPPPFPTPQNTEQVDSHPTTPISGRGTVRGSRGSLNLSLTRLPGGDSTPGIIRSRTPRDNGVQIRGLSRDRPRPASAYLPSEIQVISNPLASGGMQRAASGNLQHATSSGLQSAASGNLPSSDLQHAASGNLPSSDLQHATSSNVHHGGSSGAQFASSRALQDTSAASSLPMPSPRVATSSAHPMLQQHSHLINTNRNISASCSNIPIMEGGRRSKSSPRGGNLRRQGSTGRNFLPLAQRLKNPEVTSLPRNPSGERGREEASTSGGIIKGANGSPSTTREVTNLVANANANNTNAVASPRAGSTASPINTAAVVEAQSLSNASSHVNISIHSVSNHVNNINAQSVSSVSSQVGPDVGNSSSNAPSNVHLSSNSGGGGTSSVADSLSSRSAARLRAEARRSLVIANHSSSEEDNVTQTRARPRRRRSQGSNGFTSLSQRSQESTNSLQLQVEGHLEVCREERLSETLQAEEVVGEGRGNINPEEGVVPSQSCGREGTETVDLAPGQQPSSSSKVCGHSCQGTGGEVCCLCNKKRKRRRSPSSPECVPVEDMCALCARRCNDENTDDLTISGQSNIGCLGNMKVTLHPKTSSTSGITATPTTTSPVTTPETTHVQRNRSSKNCVVM